MSGNEAFWQLAQLSLDESGRLAKQKMVDSSAGAVPLLMGS
jgi:hypothetical protein